jgi:orotate phosphoribosyltransferase
MSFDRDALLDQVKKKAIVHGGVTLASGSEAAVEATAVVGLAALLGRALKTHAEYVVLDRDEVAPAPANFDPVAASTSVPNALTAQLSLAAR